MISASLAQTPTDYARGDLPDGKKQIAFGAVYNYPDTDSTFEAIDNTFIPEGDSVWTCNTAILKTRVNKQGVVTTTFPWKGINYQIQQRPRKLIWLNKTTKNWVDVIPSLSWPEPFFVNKIS